MSTRHPFTPSQSRRARRPLTTAALALTALLHLAPAAAQTLELYERPEFRGPRLTLDSATPDLGSYGMAGRASSLVVAAGGWELCTQPHYRGACVTLGPGRYDRLPPALNNAVSSARPALVSGRPGLPPLGLPSGLPPGAPAIVLFAGDFSGPELVLTDTVADLRSHAYNDTARTVDIRAGFWELCSDGGFSGQCLRLGPGRHVLPTALRDRLSSLRPVNSVQPLALPPPPSLPPTVGLPGRPWGGAQPAVVFYENRDFTGRQLPLVGPAPNFQAFDFNDRASSVEVFRGRWQICRHADFSGECSVIGPGRYTLDGRMSDAVSSARPMFGRGDRMMEPHGAVTLHEHGDLRGESLLVEGPVYNLRDSGFNDRTVAIEVHDGQWELCSDADFRGRCQLFGPGWYRLPEGLRRELSSLRPR